MTVLKRMLFGFSLLLPVWALAVEYTVAQPVQTFRYDGAANYLYITGANPWAATGCPDAIYVQVKPTVPGYKMLFAAALAAQANGKTVKFQGACNADPRYFDATYIVVQ